MNFKLLCGVEAVALVIGVGYIFAYCLGNGLVPTAVGFFLPYYVSLCVHGLYFYELVPHFALND